MSATVLLCAYDNLPQEERMSYAISVWQRQSLQRYYDHFAAKMDELQDGVYGSDDTQWCLLQLFRRCITSPMHLAMSAHITCRYNCGFSGRCLHNRWQQCSKDDEIRRIDRSTKQDVEQVLGELEDSPNARVGMQWRVVSPFLKRGDRYSLDAVYLFVCDLSSGDISFPEELPGNIEFFCSLLHF